MDAERALSVSELDELRFVEDYPSTFAVQVLWLVASYPAGDVGGSGTELGPWLIVRRSDDAVVGTVSCARVADGSAVTVGYDVAESCRGLGYATEALEVTVDHLFSGTEVLQVWAETEPAHVASRRVMEKAGLRWQYDEVDLVDGREVRLAHYAIDRPAPI